MKLRLSFPNFLIQGEIITTVTTKLRDTSPRQITFTGHGVQEVVADLCAPDREEFHPNLYSLDVLSYKNMRKNWLSTNSSFRATVIGTGVRDHPYFESNWEPSKLNPNGHW